MKLFPKDQVGHLVQNLSTQGVVCVPHCLTSAERNGLLEEVKGYALTQAPRELGEYKVRQDFCSFRDFPADSKFLSLRDAMQEGLNELFLSVEGKIFSKPLCFTNLVVQTYEPTHEGISPHRDGKSIINLIAVVVLEGDGHFWVCDDREGRNPRSIRNQPGDLLLMRGPGFLGEEMQPFHCVNRIVTRRTTFALRHQEVRT